MATTRGFVQRIEIGRGGLVSVTLVHDAGIRSVFTITDIDGDPERFNERLSKLAVLRDAMNRAEPVEVEHSEGEAGQEIDRAARISRDALDPPTTIDQVAGLVVDVAVHSENVTTTGGERHDMARITIFSVAGATEVLALDLQAPERLVAAEQLELVRSAHVAGWLTRFILTTREGSTVPEVIEVSANDDLSTAYGDEKDRTILSGFVESLGLISNGGGAPPGLATSRFTDAPALSGPGNTVDPAAFTPTQFTLYLAKGSLTYQLVEAGLRDNLRMRLAVASMPVVQVHDAMLAEVAGQSDSGEATTGAAPAGLLLAAELLAPIASASRPVWVHIDRSMLDKGPEADCTPGVPSSDLTPRGLRDLRIPYPAQWRGFGCFNRGVYRFQIGLPGECTVRLDDTELCLFDTDTKGVKVAYACVEGDHWLTLDIAAWTCDTDLVLDAYRIR